MISNFLLSENKIHSVLLVICLILFINTELNGQSFIKPMDNGLPASVQSSCTDSLGNVYAVTHNYYDPRFKDTFYINKWDIATNKWSVVSKISGYFNSYINYCTSNFMNGKLYVTGRNFTSGKVELMEYSGSNWKKIANINYPYNGTSLSCVKFNKQLYYIGGFDSVGGVYTPNVFTYNGSVISNAGFPLSYISGGLFESSVAIISDSMFLTSKNKILLHKSPGTWSVYKTQSYFIKSIAAVNSYLYASDYGSNAIFIYLRGQKNDSIPNLSTRSMFNFKNRIIFKDNYSYSFFTISNRKTVKPVFSLQSNDSNNISFLSFNNKLYFHASNGVIVNDIDYNNIIEIDPDSMKEVGFDTIVVKAFIDKNKNNRFDAGDQNLQSIYYSINYGHSDMFTNSNGFFTVYPLENEKLDIAFQGGIPTDSCYKLPFSGNLASTCYNSPKTRDTLYYPFRRTTLQNRNLILRSYAPYTSRMNDTTYLYVNIFNRDCDYNTSSATVKVTLDPNSVLGATNPKYTSKNGNEVTFNLTNIQPYNQSNYILLKVLYPLGKYTIGQFVKHTARLTTTFAEDTMDNRDSVRQKIVYSYDPNVKHSVPEGKINKGLKNIRYYIDFQNEGNDDAYRVTVVDTLNLKMPVYEFQMIAASHPYKVSLQPGTSVVTWVFNDINLKPKSVNEKASKGYIIFDAKVRGDLREGDSIRNKAFIYFDFNEPIITNYSVISMVNTTGNSVEKINKLSGTLALYPNPASDFVQLENTAAYNQTLTIYDMKGALVHTVTLAANSTSTLSTTAWRKGIYLFVNEYSESIKVVVE